MPRGVWKSRRLRAKSVDKPTSRHRLALKVQMRTETWREMKASLLSRVEDTRRMHRYKSSRMFFLGRITLPPNSAAFYDPANLVTRESLLVNVTEVFIAQIRPHACAVFSFSMIPSQ